MLIKEKYYTSATLDSKAAQFIGELAEFRERHKMDLNLGRAALLVIDMQEFFFKEESHAFVPSAEAIIPNVQRLQECFFSKQQPVVQTMHVDADVSDNHRKRWWGALLTEGDPLVNIQPVVLDERAILLKKSNYDAFLNTELEDVLKNRGITQLVITGVMTHLCCETTARSAFMRGFDLFFVADATATYNEQFQKATLLNLAHGFAVPVLTEEVTRICSERD